jgi:DNA polymerase-3 subunit alpha
MHAPLHNHSEYSPLDGLSRMAEIADRCLEIGCPCCGLTDHGVLSGHLEFHKVLTEKGVKPIFGCELYHGEKEMFEARERDANHLIALAMTDEGLLNLYRLVDAAQNRVRWVGRVNHELIDKYKEGLVFTSACIQGKVVQDALEGETEHLNRYLSALGDNFYLELHTYPDPDIEEMNLALVELGLERGLEFVYADDAHFAFPDQYETHDMYMARQTGQSIFTPIEDRKMWHPKDALYIRDEEGVRAALDYLPDSVVDNALENTGLIAERADATPPSVERHLPVFIPGDCKWVSEKSYKDKHADELLIDLVEKGLEDRYGEDYDDAIFERAKEELEIFIEADLSHYFLMAWDVMQFCEANNIETGPGRGSAAGCLVAYALKITDVDPLKYGLIFERFYNAGREEGLPDIDSDFPRESRRSIRQYLESKYGQDHVRHIGTIKRMKPIDCLNATAPACGIKHSHLAAIKAIVQEVPDIEILGTDSIGWDEESDPGKTIYVMDHVADEIAAYIEAQPEEDENGVRVQDLLYDWMTLVPAVCSRVANYGVHASGIVVSDVPVPEHLGGKWSSGQEVIATSFPMTTVDLLKFVKLDILGLRTLDTIQAWRELTDKYPDSWTNMEWDYVDHECWDLLEKGLSLGIFQIEDGYARRLCKEFKPRSVSDLGIIVALNRPGPIRSGAPDSFITRRNGGTDDPLLQPILEETYGWFLYQEQVIAFMTAIGYNLFEADAVRSILGKKKPEKMAELRDGTGLWEGRGYFDMMEQHFPDENSRTAFEIWDLLEDFAKYSFNKSHAIAYACLGFRSLFCKWSDPQAWTMALIKTDKENAGKYVGEARRMLINVLPPDIDKSQYASSKDGGDIRLGFGDIKGVRSSGKYVIELRDDLNYDLESPEALWDALEEEAKKHSKLKKAHELEGKIYRARSPRQQLGENKIQMMLDAGCWDERGTVESVDLPTLQAHQQELLGIILTDDTEEAFAANSDKLDECDTYDDLLSDEYDKVRLPGVIASIKKVNTKAKGEAMGVVTMEYHGDDVEYVVFPKQWRSYKFLWKERTPVVVRLRISDRGVNFEDGIKLAP